MKLTNSGFQRGYNPIVVEGDASDMNTVSYTHLTLPTIA